MTLYLITLIYLIEVLTMNKSGSILFRYDKKLNTCERRVELN